MIPELAQPRIDERLRAEKVIWLTTVRTDGQPQTSPVWFLWDGRTILLYSMPGSQKVPNIRGNPRVSLNLDGNGKGGGIVTVEGEARLEEGGPRVSEVGDYLEKYGGMIGGMGSDPDTFARAYSAAIRVTPLRARIYE